VTFEHKVQEGCVLHVCVYPPVDLIID